MHERESIENNFQKFPVIAGYLVLKVYTKGSDRIKGDER
jgi:hypothetical protein